MRITWFGNRCFRIGFNAREFVFYPEEATYVVSKNELVGMAAVISPDMTAPFEPLSTINAPVVSSRLIDALDTPDTYLYHDGVFVLDAQPDERLVVMQLPTVAVPEINDWIDGAVVLLVGTFEQCLAALEKVHGKRIRQILLAVSDIDNVSIDQFVDAVGPQRMQLLETGMAIEL